MHKHIFVNCFQIKIYLVEIIVSKIIPLIILALTRLLQKHSNKGKNGKTNEVEMRMKS